MFINSNDSILLLVKREENDSGVTDQVVILDDTVEPKLKSGRPKKKKEPLVTFKGKELKRNVPFVEGKSEKHYCDYCIKRDGEEYKEQTCSYRTPATANKSQWYRNHVAMNECPNCHKDLGIECLDWETLPKEEKKK